MRHRAQVLGAAAGGGSRTVFLDRDGVINRRRVGGYVTSWAEFEFLPGATSALRLLTDNGYRAIVVTNQRGVALGHLTERDLAEIHDQMLFEANAAGGSIAAVYYCPHEAQRCDCRKPGTGLFLEAKHDFGDIDFANSTVIGDSPSDMEAGLKLGCRTIYIGDSDRYLGAPSLYDAVARHLVGSAD